MESITHRYLLPANLEEALSALAAAPMTVLAGGTDYYPARVTRRAVEDVLHITGLTDLAAIEDCGDHYRIGALVTWSHFIGTELPSWFEGLKAAGREVGGVQIQNVGTLIGNVCNASPAADGIPNLLALDAKIELASQRGRRLIRIDEFVLGNRRTARAPDELATALIVPKPHRQAAAVFLKLGARKYLVISIVMVAIMIEIEAGQIAAARIAVGACSSAARRLRELENAVEGIFLREAAAQVRPQHFAVLEPIDDIRGSAAYRRDAALTLVRRAFEQAAKRSYS